MATQLETALDTIVQALRTAGIRASTDARDVNLPGAWVTVHDISAALAGNLAVRADVCLIAGDAGARNATAKLGRLLDAVTDVLTFDEPVRPATVTPPGMAPCPALVITTTTE